MAQPALSPFERLRLKLRERAEGSALGRRAIVEGYTRHYYYGLADTWLATTWRGVTVTKCPMDLWVYQELVHRLRPAVVVETGTFCGGSALYLADLFDLIGHGRVVTVDHIAQAGLPEHPRITYLQGSSVDPDVVARVRAEVGDAGPVMVVLDSDHRGPHVSAELDAYHGLVTPGSYLIVEDGVVNGHPVEHGYGPGPYEAADAFLAAHPEFERDPECERFGVTFNPGGWLRRTG